MQRCVIMGEKTVMRVVRDTVLSLHACRCCFRRRPWN